MPLKGSYEKHGAVDQRKPNLLWLFGKLQEYEKMKSDFAAIKKENSQLKQKLSQTNKHYNSS